MRGAIVGFDERATFGARPSRPELRNLVDRRGKRDIASGRRRERGAPFVPCVFTALALAIGEQIGSV